MASLPNSRKRSLFDLRGVVLWKWPQVLFRKGGDHGGRSKGKDQGNKYLEEMTKNSYELCKL